MTNARSVTWPAARLDEAVAALARAAGCLAADRDAPPLVDGYRSPDAVIERTAVANNLECRAIDANVADLSTLCHMAAPVILRVMLDGEERFVCVLRGRRGRIAVLGPDGTPHRVAVRELKHWLRTIAETRTPAADFLAQSIAGLRSPSRRQRARITAFAEPQRLRGCWALRPAGWGGANARARHADRAARVALRRPARRAIWPLADCVDHPSAARAPFGVRLVRSPRVGADAWDARDRPRPAVECGPDGRAGRWNRDQAACAGRRAPAADRSGPSRGRRTLPRSRARK